ncbi:PH domain-containing protein [Leucobacter sp. HY1910]
MTGAETETAWRRMHPFSPLLRGGLALLVIAGIIIGNFRDRIIDIFVGEKLWNSDEYNEIPSGAQDPLGFIAERGLVLVAMGVALAIIALIIFFSWIGWRFSTYRVTGDAVEARKGVVFRSHRRAPLERIQSVNLQRPLLARALGLTKIEIVTAGQGGKVELAYLSFQDAKAVREDILGRAAAKRGGAQVQDEHAAEANQPLEQAIEQAAEQPADQSADQSADQPATGAPSVAPAQAPAQAHAQAPAQAPAQFGSAAFDAALVARANDFVDFDIDPKAVTENTLVRVPVGRLVGSIALSWEAVSLVAVATALIVGAATIEPVMAFGLFPMVIITASIIISQFNKGFNFTLSRGHDTIRTGAGLTSTVTETIPFGRIHAVEARQPLLWRRLGWWKVRVTTAGHSVSQGGQNAAQNVVLPVGSIDDVLRVFATLLPGIGEDPRELEELREGLVGQGEGYLGAGPRAGWVLWFGRRRSGVTIGDAQAPHATLRIRRGFLTRSLGVMPVLRAQSVLFHRPLVHRMLGLATLQAHTVLGPVLMQVRGVELQAARAMFDEFAACVLRVQNSEAREIAEARASSQPAQTAPSPEPPVTHHQESHDVNGE